MSLRNVLVAKAKQMLERRGYTLVGSWHLREIVLARHLRWLFRTLSVDCVLDVGANEGQFASFLRRHVGYEGLILSFEPISDLAAKLGSLAATDPLWSVRRLALGDQAGEADINVMLNSQLSSFRQPSNEMPASYIGKNEVVRTETVPVATLADLMPELRQEHGFRRPYLKIDTQGHDLAVFRGAAGELPGFVAAQTELSLRRIYEGAPTWTEALAFLEERSFATSDLVSIGHDEKLRAVEFDCVLVNAAFSVSDA